MIHTRIGLEDFIREFRENELKLMKCEEVLFHMEMFIARNAKNYATIECEYGPSIKISIENSLAKKLIQEEKDKLSAKNNEMKSHYVQILQTIEKGMK